MIKAMTSSSSSTSTSSFNVSSKKHDVFLSFRGDDTRKNFTSHLYEALRQKKVETYIDCQLQKGDKISMALNKAIEDSHISIVIFSENYASSKWCLDELSKILECKKDQGQYVIPVFYNIDPSDVRKQSGSYEKAFTEQEGDHRCNKWKDALTQVANLAGWDSRNRLTEAEIIKDIVNDVLEKLKPRYLNKIQQKGLVGNEENIEKIESLLNVGSTDVRMVGIWGMGGFGKTTLAEVLYDKVSCEFEGRCFLKNVREQSSTQEGLIALSKKLSSDLLEEQNHDFGESHLDKCRLGRKKVFIVLDDVTTSKQLQYLNIEYDYLGPGSRVIITTRDKDILSQVDEIYKVKELNFDDSLKLFCLNALFQKYPKDGFEILSRRAISNCNGNPLALKVLGATLRSKSKKAWESRLKNFQKIPNMEVHNVLKLSYDDLDDSQKQIFLDIACFFKGWNKDDIEILLDAFNFPTIFGIEVLLDKALIIISDRNKIEMHDLIQEMGCEIVRQESINDPGRRSRLWKSEEVLEVLINNQGAEAVEGIKFYSSKFGNIKLSSDCFKRMTYLRYLSFYDYGNVHFPDGLESMSHKLKYLHWPGCSVEYLPYTFCAENLVELSMPQSNLKMLWDGVQNLVNLKIFDLSDSPNLMEIADLSRAVNLELLSLQSCKKIERVISNNHSKSLREVNLSDCSALKEFSMTSEEMTWLSLDGTAISELPSSFDRNSKLETLNLSRTNIYNLPKNMEGLSKLKELLLDDCKKLVF